MSLKMLKQKLDARLNIKQIPSAIRYPLLEKLVEKLDIKPMEQKNDSDVICVKNTQDDEFENILHSITIFNTVEVTPNHAHISVAPEDIKQFLKQNKTKKSNADVNQKQQKQQTTQNNENEDEDLKLDEIPVEQNYDTKTTTAMMDVEADKISDNDVKQQMLQKVLQQQHIDINSHSTNGTCLF